ncbi:hypothetical protein TNCV_4426471 [Trichonephila clavipes]|nr:hypothetical protein TNCV_4426471 [Trichonephila clavipes]
MNINGALFIYMRGFGDGLRNFEPWSSDEDVTLAGTPPSPTNGMTHLSSQQIERASLPYTASGTQLELMTR